MVFDLSIIVIFLILNLIVGYFSSKNIVNLDHFSVGNRSFSTLAIFATLSASFIGGGYTIGNAAKVFEIGMIYPFALLGFSLKEILVATLIAPRMGPFHDCLSIGDIIEKRYGQTPKMITGVFSILVCTGILGAQVGAMGAIFHQFFDLSPTWGILIGFAVIIFYSALGGMRAVVYTDILQFVVLIIGIPLAFIFACIHIGSWDAFMNKMPHKHLYFLQNKHDFVFFITLFITFIFGETLVPPYVQRLFMAKTPQHTRDATLASGLLSIPFFIMVGAMGLLALWYDSNIAPNNAIPFLIQNHLPGVLRGFVIAGIFSIIMSSAAGFLNAASVAFVNDIVRPLSGDSVPQKSLLTLAKTSTIFVGCGSVIFALLINNVLDILLVAYNFWSPIIIVPLVAVIFGLNVKSRDFLCGSIAGICGMSVWTWILHDPLHLNGVVIGILMNAIFFFISYQLRIFGMSTEDLVEAS